MAWALLLPTGLEPMLSGVTVYTPDFFVRVDGLAKPVSVAAQNDEHHLGQAAPTGGGEVWLRWAVKGPIVLPAD